MACSNETPGAQPTASGVLCANWAGGPKSTRAADGAYPPATFPPGLRQDGGAGQVQEDRKEVEPLQRHSAQQPCGVGRGGGQVSAAALRTEAPCPVNVLHQIHQAAVPICMCSTSSRLTRRGRR